MIDKIKVINFLQDFGCAKIKQLQTIFNVHGDNFKNILDKNVVSKKGEVLVHNNKTIDDNMLIALDILCKYKGRYTKFYQECDPVYISFLTKENLLYHIIIATRENQKGVVKLINSYPYSISKADRLILAFPDDKELENINCDIPFAYCTYPGLEIINKI